tara:strand:+ start:1076 stop:1699 length:624 start_codon:yes stop_codon:yes gene_type:complete
MSYKIEIIFNHDNNNTRGSYDRFFWKNYFFDMKQLKDENKDEINNSIMEIYILNAYKYDKDNNIIINYKLIYNIPYFKSGELTNINSFINFIPYMDKICIQFDSEIYELHYVNNTLVPSYNISQKKIKKDFNIHYKNYIQMISCFDKSDLNEELNYTYSNTHYALDFPISGIYKCFFFCGYIKNIPVHQIVGQIDTYVFFSHKLISF